MLISLLNSATGFAQNVVTPLPDCPEACAQIQIQNDETGLTPPGNFIPGCTPIRFNTRLCNLSECVANNVTVTIKIPVEFEITNLNGFVFVGMSTSNQRIFSKTINIQAEDFVTNNNCPDIFIEGLLSANASIDTKFLFTTDFSYTENGCTSTALSNMFLTPPNGVIRVSGDARNFSELDQPNTTTWGNILFVEDDLFFSPTTPVSNTRDFYFSNFDIVVANEATITLNSKTNLYVQRANIKSCDEMWEGFVVKDNSALFIERASVVRDARKVVTLEGNNAVVLTDNSKFIDNREGILNTSLVGNPSGDHGELMLYNTEFKGTGRLKAYRGLAFAQPIPLNGVKVSNLRDGFVYAATFDNMNSGYINSGTSSISNSTFKNLEVYGINSYQRNTPSGHWGISILDNTNNVFENCKRASFDALFTRITDYKSNYSKSPIGIRAEEGDFISIEKNTFSTNSGVIATDLDGFAMPKSLLLLNDNTFTSSAGATAIQLTSNRYRQGSKITKNTFNWTGISAISSTNEHIDNGDGLSIIENTKIDFRGENAINLENSFNTDITKNHDFDAFATKNGIYLKGGDKNTTFCNIVNSKTMGSSGIKVEMSPNGIMSCNTVNFPKEATGIFYSGQSNNTDIPGNTMSSIGLPKLPTGLVYDQTAQTGEQKYKGNRWIGCGANHTGNAQTSRYTVFTLFGADPTFMPDPVNPATWFQELTPAPNEFQAICSSGTCQKKTLTAEGQVSDGEGQVLVDGIQGGLYAQSSTVIMRQQYHAFLKENPTTLAGSNASVQGLFQQLDNGEIGKLYQVNQLFKNLSGGTVAQEAAKTSLETQLAAQLEVMRSFNDPIRYASGEARMALITQKRVAGNAYSSLLTAYDELMEQIGATVNTKADVIAALNNSFVCQLGSPTTNQQNINNIYLKKVIKRITLNSSELNTLASIAFQCPMEGGNAVYQARAMHTEYNPTAVYDNTCTPIGGKIMATPTKGNTLLYPNPANDVIMMNLPETHYDSAIEVSVINAQGMEVMKTTTNAVSQLNIEALAAGFYTFMIKDLTKNSLIAAQKVVLSK